MKGFQRTRTKAQDLTEIVFKQDGFLTGLNLDSPKSDVGDTQVTVLKNAIPYRDRIESRGGIISQSNYARFTAPQDFIQNESIVPFNYDEEFDEFFSVSDAGVTNWGKKNIDTTICYGVSTSQKWATVYKHIKNFGLIGTYFVSEIGDPLLWNENRVIEYREDENDYFYRPMTSDAGSVALINVYTYSGATNYKYAFFTTFVRIVDGVVVAESNVIGKVVLDAPAELNGVDTPFSLYREAFLYPDEYYDPSRTGTDNMYTHIRYYRSTLTTNTDFNDFYSEDAYYLTDYDINAADLLPGPGSGPKLNLNITDAELVSDPERVPLWQSGYRTIYGSQVYDTSSGFFISRNEAKKNEYIYCPIGFGDNRKYFGWYNAVFQYGTVDGDITAIKDFGSYVVITTENKTYYVDTVNYIEDETQRASGIFTPILPESQNISKNIGINSFQRNAFVQTYIGSAIAVTSDGEIREFSGYQWGPDLSFNKVHTITKGEIYKNTRYCQATFVNDAYYLIYDNGSVIKTLRMGTTEEAGYGFSEFEGGGWPSDYTYIDLTQPEKRPYFFVFNVKGKLNIVRTVGTYKAIYEYTGDKFDKKINKDITEEIQFLENLTYHDIPVEIEFPEMTGSSEYYFLYFLKSHFYMRADRYTYKSIDENIPGYQLTDNDLVKVSLSDSEFSIEARIGESDDIVASNNGFLHDSGVTLSREVQDNRVRITLKSDSSGFQLTGTETHFKRHDRTQLDDTETSNKISSLLDGMYCHFDHNIKNNCVSNSRGSYFDSGVRIEDALTAPSPDPIIIGNDPVIVGGPGGSTTGILIFDTSDAIELQLPNISTPSAATIMFWENSFTGKIITGWTSDNENKYEFDGRLSSGWSHTAYVFDGFNLKTYHDGVLQVSLPEILQSYIKSMSVRIYGNGMIADLRMYNKEISAEEILFYIDNIENNEGDYFNGY